MILPEQIFMNDVRQPSLTPERAAVERAVKFAENQDRKESDANRARAKEFLIKRALGLWLKSFRPLPWKHRRALWQLNSDGDQSTIISSSRMDDNDSLSMMSASVNTFNTQQQGQGKDNIWKRNLREVIEDMELDPETRKET